MKKLLLVMLALIVVAAPAYAITVTETFDYYGGGSGQLYGQGQWQNGGMTEQIKVVGNTLEIYGGAGAKNVDSASLAWGWTGVINVSFDVKKTAMADGGNSWSFRVDDQAGVNLARVYGGPYKLNGRKGDEGIITAPAFLSTAGDWDHVAIKIDTIANTSEYFFNGASLGVLAHAGGDLVGRIKWERMDSATKVGDTTSFDNLTLSVPEPGSLLALASGMFGLVGYISRRKSA